MVKFIANPVQLGGCQQGADTAGHDYPDEY
jgi:hypothetical protein